MKNATKQQGNLVTALASKRQEIEDSLPWKDLGNDERIERLRSFFKKTITNLKVQHQQDIEFLKKQIVDLQDHKHNEKGEVFVERKLNSDKHPEVARDYSFSVGTPVHDHDEPEGEDVYI